MCCHFCPAGAALHALCTLLENNKTIRKTYYAFNHNVYYTRWVMSTVFLSKWHISQMLSNQTLMRAANFTVKMTLSAHLTPRYTIVSQLAVCAQIFVSVWSSVKGRWWQFPPPARCDMTCVRVSVRVCLQPHCVCDQACPLMCPRA